jgi:DNA transformation protein
LAVSDQYIHYVLEQLAGLGRVTTRRMFGGAGLYCDGLFFGLVARDELYFKVNDSNRADYEARGMQQFKPYRDKPAVSLTYYGVPVDVIEDAEECVKWARRSLNAARGRTGRLQNV